jgi:exodeoxyribonuclease X
VARCDLLSVAEPEQWVILPEEARFVDPQRPIPPTSSAVHHIVDEDVRGAIQWPEAAAWLASGSENIFVAHNARFELSFFNPPESRWIDTYKVALFVAPHAPAHNLQTLRYWAKLQVDRARAAPPHRAGPDTYVTAHLLKRLLGKLSIEEMIRISAGPAILPRFTFGKHAMKPLPEVPSDYLEWMVRQDEMDADAKATAAHHLNLRATA